jgi:hypothetical protein
MKRPTIKSPCVADRHHVGAERIAEFSGSKGNGGLISVREMADGSLIVNVYRMDNKVEVFCSRKHWRPTADILTPEG